MRHARWTGFLCCALTLGASASAAADFQFTGFASLVGGKVLEGSRQESFPGDSGPRVDCPCYLADWANFGVYTRSFSLAEESRIGLQGSVKFSEQLGFTGQVVSRGPQTKPRLEWAYLSYKISPNIEAQIGRKRIPLYYYSDFQDVGVAYPWVAPPAELYGWDATNYNGASLRYKTSLDGVALSASALVGSERIEDDRYFLINPSPNNVHRWNGIAGADLELSRDWWTVRAVFVRSRLDFRDNDDPSWDFKGRMKAYGLAFNADFDDWFLLSEIATNNRKFDGYYVNAPAFSLGAGMRHGAWTPFLNFGQYWEKTDSADYVPVIWRRLSLSIRYDLTASSALKFQLDRYWEPREPYTGDSRLLRISYDLVF